MKITLEFDTNDEFERKDAEAALKAPDLVLAFHEIDNKLRNMTKYGQCDDLEIQKLLDDEGVGEVIHYIRTMIGAELADRGLSDLVY
jgi:hypothetical protein